jgi:hypothetical protein
MALRNGCLMLYNKMGPQPMPKEHMSWYNDYYSPLGIYDIEDSTIRHWREPEYSQYITVDLDKAKPVLYERPKDALLVAVRSGDDVNEPVSFAVKLKPLELNGGALVFDTINKKLSAMPEIDGELKFENIPVHKGPQLYRMMGTFDRPKVIWHDHVGWRVLKEDYGFIAATQMLTIHLAGVPDSESLIYVYYPLAEAPKGSNVVSWDQESKLAVYKVKFDRNAKAKLSFAY